MADKQALHQTYLPKSELFESAHVKTMEQYNEMYKHSIENPEGFWKDIAEKFYFKTPVQGKFLEYNFDVSKGPISISWMQGASTNICYNALDRHVQDGNGEKVAFFWYV